MASTQPDDIKNGDTPSANVLMLWLKTWLNNGHGIKKGTYDELKAYALTVPDDCFDCYATDIKQRMFYCGDPTLGDEGFKTLG